jgi:hypothetical protein
LSQINGLYLDVENCMTNQEVYQLIKKQFDFLELRNLGVAWPFANKKKEKRMKRYGLTVTTFKFGIHECIVEAGNELEAVDRFNAQPGYYIRFLKREMYDPLLGIEIEELAEEEQETGEGIKG